jgi:hypothetical protein
MKNALFVAILAVVLTLTASAAPAVPAVFHPIASFMKEPAKVTPFHSNDIWEIADYWYNPCNGEYVYVTGKVHVNTAGTYNEETNELKYTYHANHQNASGVGQSSGNTYRFISSGSQRANYGYSGCTLTVHSVQTYKLNAVASGDTYSVKVNIAEFYNFCTSVYEVKRDMVSFECE